MGQPAGTPEHYERPFAAGIPGQLRVIYMYGPNFAATWKVEHIEPGPAYTAFYWTTRTGPKPIGPVHPDADGSWVIPREPALTDWVLVMER
jgi:hypothetical protein